MSKTDTPQLPPPSLASVSSLISPSDEQTVASPSLASPLQLPVSPPYWRTISDTPKRSTNFSKEAVRAEMLGTRPGKQLCIRVGVDRFRLPRIKKPLPLSLPRSPSSSPLKPAPVSPPSSVAQRLRDDMIAKAPIYRPPERIASDGEHERPNGRGV